MNEEEILSSLNESQRAAVEYCDSPSLVVAGAGSGKTRVLTHKIAYLISHGMHPWNILALTFTNKAADEMKKRIAALVGTEAAHRLNMGTFHSVFSHILRIEASKIGFNSNFTIYDEGDSRSLIKQIVKQLGLNDKTYKPATVSNRISMAKNHLITATDYQIDRAAQNRDADDMMPAIGQIYTSYQAQLRRSQAMDFDDLLLFTWQLFRDDDEIRRKYASRFKYILVDEYQDTNKAQMEILCQLAEGNNRICAVGDDYQSIYGFRGANIDNILSFQTRFDGARIFKLEQNYRSTQSIVNAANSLMKHNQRQIPKDVFSKGSKGDKVTVKEFVGDEEETSFVVGEIERLKLSEHCKYSDIAIMYRTNTQSRSFEEKLRSAGVPYQIFGGVSFYQRKEIKDIVAYMRLTANPDDGEALKRIINYPARGIGQTTVGKIVDAAAAQGISLWEAAKNPAQYGISVNRGTASKLSAFCKLIESFRERMASNDISVLGKAIIKESGISAEIYKGKEADDINRQENIDEFIKSMTDFVDSAREEDRGDEVYLTDYLQVVALYSDNDKKKDANSVSLMTIHSAKGLEFPTVFIVGVEEGIFPSERATSSREIEEERRLFYVAITRAERHCYVTCVENRYRYGRLQFDRPSRFLDDIDGKLLDVDNQTSKRERRNRPWDDDYEPNTAYRGYGGWGREDGHLSNRWQNSRPVASQFRADPKPKVTSPHERETAVDPLSKKTRMRLVSEGGSWRRLNDAVSNGGRKSPDEGSEKRQSVVVDGTNIAVGSTVEHQRFGIGTVESLEGSGAGTKATVTFRNAGRKQLLLKYARLKVVK